MLKWFKTDNSENFWIYDKLLKQPPYRCYVFGTEAKALQYFAHDGILLRHLPTNKHTRIKVLTRNSPHAHYLYTYLLHSTHKEGEKHSFA